MKKIIAILYSTFLLLSHSTAIYGREPYHATVTVNNVNASVSAPNLVDLKRELKTTSLESLLPIYTPTSPVSLDINLRGLIAFTSFAANSTTLVVNIPNAGITTTFDGGTRDQSLTLFKEFIKEGSAVPRLLRAYARYSPIDPIAGNPNSLMAQMAQSDYLVGHLSPLSGCDCCWSAQPIVHQFQTGTFASRAFSKGFDTTTVTLPLRYSYSKDHHWALIVDVPFTYNRNGGASSVFGSLGIGIRVPIFSNWSITPTIRGGAGGSLDLCTSGSFVSTGLVSVYNCKLFKHVLSLTNYVGYFASTNLWLTGVNFNYHLHNTIFKNGLSCTSCKGFTICNRPINFKVSVEDTYFAGDRLFIRHYDEVSIALITHCVNPYIDYDCLSIGIAYQFGQESYKSYALNFAYQF
ncbi:hypothetical protein [Parachlamydia acanthamoebae]|jgi:hypothetical protein|uniref:Uncharacterized protein n=1 Tax=Parachlamydia acanthamoebae TaxID=83552 RepID=A0A0C1ELA4_9BACT|nr:hypothetical protein [Parachlamydia acanthamoebae]EFB40726.1 hypothetical protein pah_c197o125 [Parachlamydia acanthamoebae str. Hall's coccus]KIA77224.1 hypothetical protein DB43_GS00300 [Parachlamydia acanthamoebae]